MGDELYTIDQVSMEWPNATYYFTLQKPVDIYSNIWKPDTANIALLYYALNSYLKNNY